MEDIKTWTWYQYLDWRYTEQFTEYHHLSFKGAPNATCRIAKRGRLNSYTYRHALWNVPLILWRLAQVRSIQLADIRNLIDNMKSRSYAHVASMLQVRSLPCSSLLQQWSKCKDSQHEVNQSCKSCLYIWYERCSATTTYIRYVLTVQNDLERTPPDPWVAFPRLITEWRTHCASLSSEELNAPHNVCSIHRSTRTK